MKPHGQTDLIHLSQINAEICALHDAYCAARGIEMEMSEDQSKIWEAVRRDKIKPDDISVWTKRVVAENKRRLIRDGGSTKYQSKVSVGWLFKEQWKRDEIREFIAEQKAQDRKLVYPAGKAAVLRATARSDEHPTPEAKHVASLKLIEDLRKAAGM